MAFFCTKSGKRIVAPGVALSEGGEVPEFVHGHRPSEWAEEAAIAALHAAAPKPAVTGNQIAGHQQDPTPDALSRALAAAIAELDDGEPFAGEPEKHFAKRHPMIYAAFLASKAPWSTPADHASIAASLKSTPAETVHADPAEEEGPSSKPGSVPPAAKAEQSPPLAAPKPEEAPAKVDEPPPAPPASSSAAPTQIAGAAKAAPAVERPKKAS